METKQISEYENQEEMREPGYFAVIPANVRHDKALTANAKLLYGEITSLCNSRGYCWAQNTFFANLYDVHVRKIQEWLKQLRDKGYIELYVAGHNKRYIWLPNAPVPEAVYNDMAKQQKAPHAENGVPHAENGVPHAENGVPHNPATPRHDWAEGQKNEPNNKGNNKDNNKENISSSGKPQDNPAHPSTGGKKRESKKKQEEPDERFLTFYAAYPKKQGKKQALAAWNKLKPDDALLNQIMAALSAQKQQEQWQGNGGKYIPLPATWLNGERWNDELTVTTARKSQKVQWAK